MVVFEIRIQLQDFEAKLWCEGTLFAVGDETFVALRNRAHANGITNLLVEIHCFAHCIFGLEHCSGYAQLE